MLSAASVAGVGGGKRSFAVGGGKGAVYKGDRVSIKDLGSTSGTKVNGKKIKPSQRQCPDWHSAIQYYADMA